MSTKTKILIAEHDPVDLELLVNELKKSGINYESQIVDNGEDYGNALKNFIPDIILSDFTFPSFDGPAAFKLKQEIAPEIPFIFVTGTIGEEKSIAFIKNGVTDYVLKDKLFTLTSKIKRGLKESIEKHEKNNINDKNRIQAVLLNTIGQAVMAADLNGIINFWNKAAEVLYGWTAEEAIGNNVLDLIPSQQTKEQAAAIMSALYEGNSWSGELVMQRKDGTSFTAFLTDSPVYDSRHKLVGIIGISSDLTERKKADKNLMQSEARLKEAQSIAHISNWDIDMVNNTHTWSDEFYKIHGINKGDVQPSAEAFLSFIHPEDVMFAQKKMQEAFETLKASSMNFRFIQKDGTLKYGYTEWRFEFDKNHNPIRLYGILQDVSERKIADEEREKMITDMVQRNRDLEQFSFITSHNLRAPTANIIGFTENLLEETTTAIERKESLHGLSMSVSRLDTVIKDINKILQVKRIADENKETICFTTLVNDIFISIGNLIDKHNVRIKYDFSAVDEICSLKGYIYSIFYNLITNSIKYRQPNVPPLIEIKSKNENGKIILTFKDNGLGIDLQAKGDKVFGLYKRFHTHVEGKGMGLFMVKTQVESLGGKISIESELNEGTTFKIEFENK
jgi:PAS domain S-box-containing protein